MTFKDHFSRHAAQYSAFRPRYPASLFRWLATAAPSRRRAWDAGCGSGQASAALAAEFEEVIATDASAEQLAHSTPHGRVAYRVAPAEDSGIVAGSVDLITVAQALHWFDIDRFAAEVRRVAAPGAVVAAWCYPQHRIAPAVDALVTRLWEDIVGAWWPPERRHVDNGYRDLRPVLLAPPAVAMDAPDFEMRAAWTLEDLLGYLETSSAVQRYRASEGRDPVAEVRDELAQAWGDVSARRDVRWPLTLVVGRVGG